MLSLNCHYKDVYFHIKGENMRTKKKLSSNHRKRTLHRNKIKLMNRRQALFSLEQMNR
mgnify:CR=1 FL=1